MSRKSREDMRVVVLAGGISDEREISRASGANVVTATDQNKAPTAVLESL